MLLRFGLISSEVETEKGIFTVAGKKAMPGLC